MIFPFFFLEWNTFKIFIRYLLYYTASNSKETLIQQRGTNCCHLFLLIEILQRPEIESAQKSPQKRAKEWNSPVRTGENPELPLHAALHGHGTCSAGKYSPACPELLGTTLRDHRELFFRNKAGILAPKISGEGGEGKKAQNYLQHNRNS